MNTVPHIMEYLWVFVGSMGGVGKMVNDTTEASDGGKNTKGLETHEESGTNVSCLHTQPVLQSMSSVYLEYFIHLIYLCLSFPTRQ